MENPGFKFHKLATDFVSGSDIRRKDHGYADMLK